MRAISIAGSVIAFLVAAKAHGRQLRLERELAGHWNVTFGAVNHPFVDALWRSERVRFWGLAAALALVTLAGVPLARRVGWRVPFLGEAARSFWVLALVAVVWSMTVAFVVTGLASLVRFVTTTPVPTSVAAEAWKRDAVLGSVGWWVLTLVVLVAMAFLARRLSGVGT